jgi:hypothetical protein
MASSSRFGGRRGAFVVSAFGLLAALAAAVVACEGDTAD